VRYRPTLSVEHQEARAKTAVGEFLFHRLIVPKVFLDAPWPGGHNEVDVVAVDRSGSGEVHVAEVKVGAMSPEAADVAISSLMQIPAHFKYLAIFDGNDYVPEEARLYAPNGMGRVGVIRVKENEDGDLSAEFRVRPERFKFEASFKLVDKFTAAHQPDIEVRP